MSSNLSILPERPAANGLNARAIRRCELLDRCCPVICHRHQSLRRVACKICVLRDALEVEMDGVAKHSERDRWFAFKKRAAQVFLQSAYGICQRRLRDAAASSRPRETALLTNRQKITNLLQLHHPSASAVVVQQNCHGMSGLECDVIHKSRRSFYSLMLGPPPWIRAAGQRVRRPGRSPSPPRSHPTM
jgi:hypothetical protein